MTCTWTGGKRGKEQVRRKRLSASVEGGGKSMKHRLAAQGMTWGELHPISRFSGWGEEKEVPSHRGAGRWVGMRSEKTGGRLAFF